MPELAAGLAYRFLFAVFPFAIFVAALAAFVARRSGSATRPTQILGAIDDNLPPDVAAQIAPQLESVLGQTRPGAPEHRRARSRCGPRPAASRR